MKETKTINLNGLVYNIDEDAYNHLKNYLNDIASRLSKEDETEVMQDIEARIGELFNTKLFANATQIVTMTMVEQVVKKIGSPDAFGEKCAEEAKPKPKPVQAQTKASQSAPSSSNSGCLRAFAIVIIVLGCLIIIPVAIPLLFAVGLSGMVLGAIGIHLLPILVFVLLPIIALICLLVYYLRHRKAPRARFWWIMLAIWLIAGIWCGFIGKNLKNNETFQDIKNTIHQLGIVNWLDNDYDDYDANSETITMSFDTLPAFNAINVCSPVEVNVTQGLGQMVKIEGPERELSSFNLRVEDSVLFISLPVSKYANYEVDITVPTIKTIFASAASSVDVENFQGDSLEVVASAAAKLDVDNMHYNYAKLDLSSAANVELSGVVTNLDAQLSSASNLDAEDCRTNVAKLNCSGASEVEITCNESLSAQASGASKIYYYGNPTIDKKIAIGGGKIAHRK